MRGAHFPAARIGWVVEEAFAPLVRAELCGRHRHPRCVAPLARARRSRRNLA